MDIEQNNTAVHDPLPLWEKVPLILLVAAQVLVVFRWYTGQAVPTWVVTMFGACAALALDLVVTTTTIGRRAGRESGWSWLTSAAAAVFSALVALDAYGAIAANAWLHAAYPLVGFIYAQHLAQRRRGPDERDASPAAPGAAPSAQATVNVLTLQHDMEDVRSFIRWRAQLLRASDPSLTFEALAKRMRTSGDTVRRALIEVDEEVDDDATR